MTEPDIEQLDDPLPVEDAVHVVADVTAAIRGADSRWTDGEVLDLPNGKRWTPHLARDGWVLHVHLSEQLPGYMKRRLQAAGESSRIAVALSFEALYDADLLRLLARLDAYVYVIEDPRGDHRIRHYLAAIADLSVPVAPQLRCDLALIAWALRSEGTAQQRGQRLEALLAFVLSQVDGFKIFRRNFRTETAEIDIVLQVDNATTRCWATPGVPFVHVEAKNWALPQTVGAPIVTLMVGKLRNTRGRARLGLLFATTTITEDARKEELRLSESDLCVAMFDEAATEELLGTLDLDDHFDGVIGRAMLR